MDGQAGCGGEKTDEEAGQETLYSTAQRKIVDRLRYHHRGKRDIEREVQHPGGRSDGGDDQLMHAYATFRTPSQDAIVREQIEQVERAFDELPEDYRELITLHRIAGLSYAEIAGQLSTTEEAVRKKLARAMARLSRILRASTQPET